MKNILLKIACGIVFLTIFGCEKQEKVITPLPIINIGSDEFYRTHVDYSFQGPSSWHWYSKAIKLDDEKKDTVYSLSYWERVDKIRLKINELQKFKNLKAFQIADAKQSDIIVLKNLPNLSKLKQIRLAGLNSLFGKVELDSLFSKDLSSLQELEINSTHLDSNFNLKNCQNIQSLDLSSISFPHLLRELASLKKLKILYLERIHEMDIVQVCLIASKMKNLKTMRISNMGLYGRISDTIPREIGLLKNIEQLELRLYMENPVFPDEIKELKNLKRLYLLGGQREEVLKQVQEKLPNCQIYDV